MLLHVNVTKTDILRGKRDNCSRCPIALAVTRAAKKAKVLDRFGMSPERAWVERTKATWRKEHFAILPLEAQRFIDYFDSGYAVTPFAFDLDDQKTSTTD